MSLSKCSTWSWRRSKKSKNKGFFGSATIGKKKKKRHTSFQEQYVYLCVKREKRHYNEKFGHSWSIIPCCALCSLNIVAKEFSFNQAHLDCSFSNFWCWILWQESSSGFRLMAATKSICSRCHLKVEWVYHSSSVSQMSWEPLYSQMFSLQLVLFRTIWL